MTLSSTDSNSDGVDAAHDNRQLAKVLETYLAKLDAGQRPDRDAIFAAYPELAQPLSDCLDALELVHHVAPQLGRSGDGVARDSAQRMVHDAVALGDFQIIREIGRGGMGVVYEAKQLSLGRRVALKVMPFASMLDKRQLARFKNEAQAAALLQHQHIVPVYSTGCDRGVHFYAMQYVDGEPLDNVINALATAESSQQAASRSDVSTIARPSPNSGVSTEARPSELSTAAIAAGSLSTERARHRPGYFAQCPG